MHYNEIKALAQKLRNNPTPEEELLWSFIRKDQIHGRRMLRQHPIIYESNKKEHFFFIPDFYCGSKKLAIELDGGVHDSQQERDQHRDEILISMGITVLHITNDELKNMPRVLKKIKKYLL